MTKIYFTKETLRKYFEYTNNNQTVKVIIQNSNVDLKQNKSLNRVSGCSSTLYHRLLYILNKHSVNLWSEKWSYQSLYTHALTSQLLGTFLSH